MIQDNPNNANKAFQIPCRNCGSPLHRSASGIICLECKSKIIPSGEISNHYEAYSDHHVDLLPENHCNNTQEIANTIGRIRKLEAGKLTTKQREKLEQAQDRSFKRMTYRRLKIENEKLRQKRLLFDGDEPEEIQFQPTLF